MAVLNIYNSTTIVGVLGIVGSFMILVGPSTNIHLKRLPTQNGTQVDIPPMNASTSSLERHVMEITNEEEAKAFLHYVDKGRNFYTTF